MNTPPSASKRRGARAAKRALRAAPLAEEDRAVSPGMLGGGYGNPVHHRIITGYSVVH